MMFSRACPLDNSSRNVNFCNAAGWQKFCQASVKMTISPGVSCIKAGAGGLLSAADRFRACKSIVFLSLSSRLAFGGFERVQICWVLLIRVIPITTLFAELSALELSSKSDDWQRGSVSGARVGKFAAGWVGNGLLSLLPHAVMIKITRKTSNE